MATVSIVEVGPRDGFQSVKPFIATDLKIDLIRRLAETGLQRIEVGSYVSPAAIPQMRDIGEILTAIRKGTHPELSVLVPNLKGAHLAAGAEMDNIVYVISASEKHNQANVRKTVEASLDELRTLLTEHRPKGRFRFNLATAFDCPYEGTTPLEQTLRIVAKVIELAPDAEICLCDTTGKAVPKQVEEAFAACFEAHGARNWAYHAHDTYGLGLASTLAAYRSGVRVFDASIAGLGGCPFAPGATGNVATEDVVFLFENSGIVTGIDLDRLVEVAHLAETIDGAVVGGHIRGLSENRCSVEGPAAKTVVDDGC
jgi:hydroxymethylglutaryl-CoA lyase